MIPSAPGGAPPPSSISDPDARANRIRRIEKGAMALLLGLAAGLYKGWILSLLWQWFVMAKFGLPEITAVHGMGICLIGDLFLSARPNDIVDQASRLRDKDTLRLDEAQAAILMARIMNDSFFFLFLKLGLQSLGPATVTLATGMFLHWASSP